MITTYLKAKNSLHATRISSFKYVFIVFLKKKQMLKYTLKLEICVLCREFLAFEYVFIV